MSFRLIEAERAQHRVSRLCQALGVTRAGYYAWKGRAPSRRALADRELRALISRIFADSRETYGAPRIQAELADEHGLRVSRKRVARGQARRDLSVRIACLPFAQLPRGPAIRRGRVGRTPR